MAMKDSGIAWIGEIPEHWNIKKLKYLLKPNCVNMRVGPFGSALSGDDFKDEGYWVYNQRCVLDKNFETNDTFVDEYKYKELNAFTVDTGDMLITTRGTIGKVAIVPENCPVGILHPCIIKFVLNQDLINNELVEIIFNNSNMIMDQIMKKSNATTIDVIYSYTLKDLLLPVIPMNEQIEIIDFLDKKCFEIDDILVDLNKQVEILTAYKKSLITETVTKGLNPNAPMEDSGIDWIGKIPEHWKTKKLKYLTNLIIDGTHNTPTYVDEGVPFLRVTDITSGGVIDIDSVAKIPIEEHLDISKRCCPKKGDLLVSKNGTIGVPKLIDWDWDFSIFVSLCLIKTKSFLSSKYLLYYFKSSLIDSEIAFGGKTNTITNLHLEKIANFVIPVTSIDEQECIVEYLDIKCAEIDGLISDKTAQIDKMEKYKKSLIFEYVTGKKRVKEVV